MYILKLLISFSTIPLLLFLGIKTSYTDLKKNKIYNKDLLTILILGSILQIISLILLKILFPNYFHNKLLFNIVLNSSISLLTGLIFWGFKLWAAGDVKLLYVFSVLIPINIYLLHINRIFPSFDALVNTFVFAILFIIIEILYLFKKNITKIEIKKFNKLTKKKLINFFKIIFSFIFMLLVINKVRNIFMENIFFIARFDMLYFYVIVFIFFNKIMRFLQNNIIFFISLFGMIFYISYNMKLENYNFLKDLLGFISIGFLITLLSTIITKYLEKTDNKEISLSNLQENMILTNESLKLFEKNEKIDESIKQNLKDITTDGLTKNHVEILKQYYPYKTIRIENTFAFAPFIFLGVLSSLILNKSILELLLLLFYKK